MRGASAELLDALDQVADPLCDQPVERLENLVDRDDPRRGLQPAGADWTSPTYAQL